MTAESITMTAVMAWRNLWRNRRRTLITVTAMVLGLALCIPMYGMGAWMTQEMTRGITRLHLGNIQVHDPRYPAERNMLDAFPAALAEKVGAVPGVQAVSPRVYSGGMVSADHRIAVQIAGIAGALPQDRRLVSGSGLSGKAHSCSALIPRSLADKWHMAPGTALRLDPLPENSTCERLDVTGILSDGKDADLFIYVSPATLADIATKTPADAEGSDDEDIDDLPRLPDTTREPGKQGPAEKEAATRKPGTKGGAAKHADGKDEPGGNEPASRKRVAQTISGPLAWHVIRSASVPVGIMAVMPSRERQVTAVARSIVEGRYLPDEIGPGPLPVLIGKPLAEKLLVKPGDRLGMDVMTPDGFPVDALFVVVGIFETGVMEMDRSLVQAPLALAWRKDLMNLRDPTTDAELVNELAIRTKEGLSESLVAARIRKVLPGLLVRTWRQVDPNTAQILKYQDSATAVFLAIIFVIAALGTTNTMLMSVHERTKEFGVLKSVGMSPGRVAALILAEALVMTALATILGGLLGTGIAWWLAHHGLDLRSINPEGLRYQGLVISPIWKAVVTRQVVAVPAILLASVSLMVSVWPALRAARIQPVEALRNEL